MEKIRRKFHRPSVRNNWVPEPHPGSGAGVMTRDPSRQVSGAVGEYPGQALSYADVPTNHMFAFALYDFTAEDEDEVDFKYGDLLELKQLPASSDSGEWIEAKNPRSGKTGKVPSNYLSREKGDSAALDAFRYIDRSTASKLLTFPEYISEFNYVVRRCSEDPKNLALSVRKSTGEVRHFRIHFNETQQMCFLFPDKPFETLEDLIIYYMDHELETGVTLQAYKPFKDNDGQYAYS